MQVRSIVIQGIAVMVVHDPTTRERAIGSLPVHDGAQAPAVRLGHLDPSSRRPILVVPESDRPDRQFVRRDAPRLELRGRGKVQALGVRLAPRHDAWREAGLAPARARASLSILGRAAFRAALSALGSRWLVFEGGSAPLARFFHSPSVAVAGLGTVPTGA